MPEKLVSELPAMSSPTPLFGGASGPTSTVPPPDNSSTSSPPVNDTITVGQPPPSPGVLLLPPPPGGNERVFSSPPPSGSSNKTTLVALGVGIGIGGAIVLFCVGIFVLWYKRRKRRLGLNGFSYAPPPHGPKSEILKIF